MGFVQLSRQARPRDRVPDARRTCSRAGHVPLAFGLGVRARVHSTTGGSGSTSLVSSGQEIVTTVADYLGVRARPREHAGRRRCSSRRSGTRTGSAPRSRGRANADVPVVALKVGRTEALDAEMVAAHSGALAGEDGAYEALFEADGVHGSASLDEMADTLELFEAGRRGRPGGDRERPRLGRRAARCSSTSRRTLGVPFARSRTPTIGAGCRDVLDPGLIAGEPARRLGDGHRRRPDLPRVLPRARTTIRETAASRSSSTSPGRASPTTWATCRSRTTCVATTDKPFCDPVEPRERDRPATRSGMLADAGHPRARGHGDRASARFKHLLDAPRPGRLPPRRRSSPRRTRRSRDAGARGSRAASRSTSPRALALLADYGIPVAASRAGRVARRRRSRPRSAIGFPVAIKTAMPERPHKSDVGGVRLGLADADAVAGAYRRLAGGARSPGHGRGDGAGRASSSRSGSSATRSSGRSCSSRRAASSSRCCKTGGSALPPLDEAARAAPDRRPRDPAAARRLPRRRRRPTSTRSSARSSPSVVARERSRRPLVALDVNPSSCRPDGCVAVDALVIPGVRA